MQLQEEGWASLCMGQVSFLWTCVHDVQPGNFILAEEEQWGSLAWPLSVKEGIFPCPISWGGGPETKACSTLSWWCHAKCWNIRSSRFDHLRDWGLFRASENVCISDIHSNWNFQDSPQVPLLEGIQLLYSHHERPSVGPIKEPS